LRAHASEWCRYALADARARKSRRRARVRAAHLTENEITDARFSTNIARLANRAAIEGQVRDWFSARTASEAASILTAHDVSFSPIYDIRDICEDEHFKAREAVISVEDSHFGSVRMQNVVPRFSRTPGRVWRTGPALGEHNDEISGEFLRMTREEIEALKKARVI
jgi:crotonobetainyl-CoA:carnitine CoA-transferase CaiB-like acyl-CoA transferase